MNEDKKKPDQPEKTPTDEELSEEELDAAAGGFKAGADLSSKFKAGADLSSKYSAGDADSRDR